MNIDFEKIKEYFLLTLWFVIIPLSVILINHDTTVKQHPNFTTFNFFLLYTVMYIATVISVGIFGMVCLMDKLPIKK
tara:strand:+ start:61 stop:291 length:231 start_codon:yes stop_codon:yes gene_type:complete